MLRPVAMMRPMPTTDDRDRRVFERLRDAARERGLDLAGGHVRRTSSRFCFGVEHGDYNGTSLFGVGCDRFLWLGWQPNDSGRVRAFSANFPNEGIVDVDLRATTPGGSDAPDGWARYVQGAASVLRDAGFDVASGFDCVLHGDIPGGGMSRSASLCLNLLLTLLERNSIELDDRFRIVEMAQRIENVHVGSPCGILDQTMILFAKAGHGTQFDPATRTVRHVPFGGDPESFRLVALDTGTVRPGLEQSTYRLRRAECERLLALAQDEGFAITALADVRDQAQLDELRGWFGADHPDLIDRLDYLVAAQRNFTLLLAAWERGDIATVGRLFREDGIGLRDRYRISGPELETMCDIARTVPGVHGERMLGGGDKGASGAVVAREAVPALREAVDVGYPRAHPAFADRYAVHELRVVDGVAEFPGVL